MNRSGTRSGQTGMSRPADKAPEPYMPTLQASP